MNTMRIIVVLLVSAVIMGGYGIATGVTLKWDRPATGVVTQYEIEYGESSGAGEPVHKKGITLTEYYPDYKSLKPETEYYFRVRAWNGETPGEWSETWSWRTPAEGEDATPPLPTTGLDKCAGSGGS